MAERKAGGDGKAPKYEDLIVIDALTFSSTVDRDMLLKMKNAGFTCLTNTLSIWDGPLETIRTIRRWDHLISANSDIVTKVVNADQIPKVKKEGKLGVVYGFQNSSPVNGELDLVDVMYQLGVRVMQLTYNNASLAAAGCYETEDAGLTRFGKELVREMNQVGMIIDLAHVGDRSSLDAIEWSERPVAITHSNPKWFNDVSRNKSDRVLDALKAHHGVIGVSGFAMLMPGGSPEFVQSKVSLKEFAEMIARLVDQIGIEHVGIGTDQGGGHTDATIQVARTGTWTRKSIPRRVYEKADWGKDGSSDQVPSMYKGMRDLGFHADEITAIMGGNWLRLYKDGFSPR